MEDFISTLLFLLMIIFIYYKGIKSKNNENPSKYKKYKYDESTVFDIKNYSETSSYNHCEVIDPKKSFKRYTEKYDDIENSESIYEESSELNKNTFVNKENDKSKNFNNLYRKVNRDNNDFGWIHAATKDVPDIVPMSPDQREIAGDRGEAILLSSIEKKSDKTLGCYWWSNKRVKDQGESGKSEIDLLLISHNYIYLFESKYWSGTLTINPNIADKKNRWVFYKPKYIGNVKSNEDTEIILFEDMTVDLLHKMEKLKSKLEKNKIIIDREKFKNMIVFTNSRINIDESIKENDKVVSLSDLDKHLDNDLKNLSKEEIIIISLVRHIINLEYTDKTKNCLNQAWKECSNSDIPLTANIDLIKFIQNLPSWDTIKFYGGKTVRGDILKIQKTFNNLRDDILTNDCKISVKTPRNKYEIIDKINKQEDLTVEIKRNGELKIQTSINPEFSKIKFHKVGSEKPEWISIYSIEEIHLNGLYNQSHEKK